jgi:hypothetical protein
MNPIDSFSLAKHDGPYETWPDRTRLFYDGKNTAVEIPGFIIEAQYRCRHGFLLITSQACPYEESNDFILLDLALKLVATKELGRAYCSFLLEAHRPIGPDTLLLEYNEGLFFTLSVRPRLGGWRGYKLVLNRLLPSKIGQ